jgi:hypothetical protein
LFVALKDRTAAHHCLDFIIGNGYVYCDINKGMYGLPQAGILANSDLIIHLKHNGYDTPCLITHQTQPISFCLVPDDIGVKYFGEDCANHVIEDL